MQVQATIVVERLNNCMALVYLGIARTQTVPGTISAMYVSSFNRCYIGIYKYIKMLFTNIRVYLTG